MKFTHPVPYHMIPKDCAWGLTLTLVLTPILTLTIILMLTEPTHLYGAVGKGTAGWLGGRHERPPLSKKGEGGLWRYHPIPAMLMIDCICIDTGSMHAYCKFHMHVKISVPVAAQGLSHAIAAATGIGA